jgi:hypothetical protein
MLLQMDNYVKDNKNHHLLTFLSFLIVREMFEECTKPIMKQSPIKIGCEKLIMHPKKKNQFVK